MIVRKADLKDVHAIQILINYFAAKDEMLPKSLSVLYENVRDFMVAYDDDNNLLGCCAAHVCWEDLAEVKSLAIREDIHGMGIGKKLVKACINDITQLGIKKIFALTYAVGFFEKLGFRLVEKNTLPHKIWSECINCPKFPDCGEEAVMLEL